MAAGSTQRDADYMALANDGASSRRDAHHSINRDQDILYPKDSSFKESHGEMHGYYYLCHRFLPPSSKMY